MIVYLDTSVVLRVLLGQPNALAEWGSWETAFSSELMGVEARRISDRLRLQGALDDEGIAQAEERLTLVERTLGKLPLTRTVLQRASRPMPTVVRTLDAIHLASAALYREHRHGELVFATHDRQQSVGARSLGFECIGV